MWVLVGVLAILRAFNLTRGLKMLRIAVLSAALVGPSLALACGGDKAGQHAKVEATAPVNPAACAKKAELVGANCSYSTGMMAQRVVAEGAPFTYAGRLAQAEGELASHVAAPFVVGPEKISVVANEVLEQLTTAGVVASRLQLEGKLLEVDGVKYFVLTGFQALNA